jgi:hypothetical protein
MSLTGFLLAALSATVTVTGTDRDHGTKLEQVLLRCGEGTRFVQTSSHASLDQIEPTFQRTTLDLVRSAGEFHVVQRTRIDGDWQVVPVATRTVAFDPAARYYHLEANGQGAVEHLFFTVDTDDSGSLLWSTESETLQIGCLVY